jgi:hypothetical protein
MYRSCDGLLAVFVAVQCGVFTRRQALECGFTDRMIRARLRSGAWERVAPGVYRLPDHRPTWRQRLWIARLTVDTFAAVSHESAAAIHRCPGFPEGPVVLLVRHGTHARPRGATVHETRDFWLDDCELIDGLLVTTPARMLLDLAGVATRERRLRVAAEDLVVRHKTTFGDINEQLKRQARRGKPGILLLTRVLDSLQGEPVKQSELERRLFALFDRYGGPRPQPQWPYPGRLQVNGCADAGFPDAYLAVETDGRRWHTRVQDLKRDHERDAEAGRHGVQVLRVLHEHVVGDPLGTWQLIQDVRRIRLSQLQANWRQ